MSRRRDPSQHSSQRRSANDTHFPPINEATVLPVRNSESVSSDLKSSNNYDEVAVQQPEERRYGIFSPQLVRYILLALIMAVFVVLLVRANDVFTMGGASIGTWVVFLLAIGLLIPISMILSKLARALAVFLIDSPSWTLYLLNIEGPFAFLIWLILFVIAFEVVFFTINPFSGESDHELDRPWWLGRVYISFFILAGLLILRKALLVKLGNKTQTNPDLVMRTRRSIRAQQMIEKLTEDWNARDFDKRQIKPREGSTEEQAALVIQRFFRKIVAVGRTSPELPVVVPPTAMAVEEPLSVTELDSVINQPITACNGRRPIERERTAQKLGDNLHRAFAGKDGRVPMAKLSAACPDHKPKEVAEIFDPNGTGTLSRETLIERCEQIVRNRKTISQTYADLQSVIIALGSFLSVAVSIFMFFVLTLVFSTGAFQNITVTAGSTLFALSFIFGETAKNVFNSFIFLFVRHPFDVDDRVQVMPDMTTMYVVRMELLTTTFRQWSGHITTIPNHVLHNMQIINHRRSPPMTDMVEFIIDYKTPLAKIKLIEERFLDYCRSLPNDYNMEKVGIALRNIVDTNGLKLEVFLAQTTNWQNGDHYPRRTKAIYFFKSLFEELEIKYYPPTLHIERVEPPQPNAAPTLQRAFQSESRLGVPV